MAKGTSPRQQVHTVDIYKYILATPSQQNNIEFIISMWIRLIVSISGHSMFLRLGWDKQDKDKFSVYTCGPIQSRAQAM